MADGMSFNVIVDSKRLNVPERVSATPRGENVSPDPGKSKNEEAHFGQRVIHVAAATEDTPSEEMFQAVSDGLTHVKNRDAIDTENLLLLEKMTNAKKNRKIYTGGEVFSDDDVAHDQDPQNDPSALIFQKGPSRPPTATQFARLCNFPVRTERPELIKRNPFTELELPSGFTLGANSDLPSLQNQPVKSKSLVKGENNNETNSNSLVQEGDQSRNMDIDSFTTEKQSVSVDVNNDSLGERQRDETSPLKSVNIENVESVAESKSVEVPCIVSISVRDLTKTKDFYVIYFDDLETVKGQFDESTMLIDGLQLNLYMEVSSNKVATALKEMNHDPETSNILSVSLATTSEEEVFVNLISFHGPDFSTDGTRVRLAQFVSECSGCDVIRMIQHDEPRSIILVFDIDSYEDLAQVLWGCITSDFDGTRLTCSPVQKHDTIIVNGLHEHIKDFELREYLESVCAGKGGKVKHMRRLNQSTAFIKFDGGNGAQRAINKGNSSRRWLGVYIHYYHPCLSPYEYEKHLERSARQLAYTARFGPEKSVTSLSLAGQSSPAEQQSTPEPKPLPASERSMTRMASVNTFKDRNETPGFQQETLTPLTKDLDISAATQKYFLKCFRKELSKLESFLSHKDVKLEQGTDKFTLSGPSKVVELGFRALCVLRDRVQAEEVHLKYIGAREFLHSETGQQIVQDVTRSSSCTIEVVPLPQPEDPPNPQEDVQSEHQQQQQQQQQQSKGIDIAIVSDSIKQLKSDVIVSTVGKNLYLQNEKLSKQILRQGGSELQEELNDSYPGGVKHGEFAQTSGGHLRCQTIFHACLPPWSNKANVMMMRLFFEMLRFANNMGLKSLSTPLLGTGTYRYPLDIAATGMLLVIKRFEERFPERHLQTVNVFFASYQQAALEAFQSAMSQRATDDKRMLEKTQQQPTLEIYYQNMEEKDSVVAQLRDRCKRAFQTLPAVKDEKSSKLKASQMKELQNYAIECLVKFTVNSSKKEINMAGFFVDKLVLVLNKWTALQPEEKKEIYQNQANRELLPTIQWQFMREDKWVNFGPGLNQHLESQYKEFHKEREESKRFYHTQDKEGSRACVDLHRMKQFPLDKEGYLSSVGVDVQRYDPAADALALPSTWAGMKENEELKVIQLSSNSSEYKNVACFFRHKGAKFKILNIERVQNKTLYRQYMIKKREMERRNTGGNSNEQRLFHGTDAPNSASICRHGFNRSYSGKHATLFGEGVYFSKLPSYSAAFSQPDSDRNKRMFLAQVLVGESTAGTTNLRYLPLRPGTTIPYDSALGPDMYVIFHDTQAYPGHIITFKI
ncbi:uncharacterized protein LOC101848260 [Aplysia californica]|uniref:Poly [ADP-ribose] polymerase n=1 Tax=Aplysia californica TaxID=6500 RepID=A0ABM0JCS1_APLCA|nr:uncharacterized protein LOC101848260 [Aplysia californica]